MNQDFVEKIIAARGDAGSNWLNSIPQIIEKYSQKWNLEVLPPFKLTYNYVAPAKRKIYGN